jgi:hypothetical protein
MVSQIKDQMLQRNKLKNSQTIRQNIKEADENRFILEVDNN